MLEKQFEAAHLQYLTATDEKTQRFKELTQENEDALAEMRSTKEMIQKKYAELSAWNAKLKANTRDFTER